MAYLKSTRITCPKCGFAANIEIVVGVGPGSRKGDVPYRSYRESGPFIAELDHEDERTGRLLCPADSTPVWTNSGTKYVQGPLTAQEMQGPHGRRWLVPGTENPFPPEPVEFDARDPFSGPRPIKPVKRG